MLVFVLATSACLTLHLVVVSAVQQKASQQLAFDRFRAQLAEGTAAVGPTDSEGRQLAPGAPVAYLEIPAIGVKEVVVEGTSSSELLTGPGHRRDTALPGQAGTSVVMGRRAAFGGPFARLADLEAGDLVRATTGQGVFEYRVTGTRQEGDPMPEGPGLGEARLVLATAAGPAYVPSGVLWVDAELSGPAQFGPARLVEAASLPAEEVALAVDTGTLWSLVLWLQALVVVLGAAIWAWHRLGRARTWVVGVPPVLLVGLATAGEVARLLPNLV